MPSDGSGLRQLEVKVTRLRMLIQLLSENYRGSTDQKRAKKSEWVYDIVLREWRALGGKVLNSRPMKRLCRNLWKALDAAKQLKEQVAATISQHWGRRPAYAVEVVSRLDERGIFAQLMAAPREKGQLLC